MKLPSVYPLTSPSSQPTNRITNIVHNIGRFSFQRYRNYASALPSIANRNSCLQKVSGCTVISRSPGTSQEDCKSNFYSEWLWGYLPNHSCRADRKMENDQSINNAIMSHSENIVRA